MEGVLVRQAREVLQYRYGFNPEVEQHLRQLVRATQDAPASALTVRSQCTFAEADAADCLLLLEVLALAFGQLDEPLSESS